MQEDNKWHELTKRNKEIFRYEYRNKNKICPLSHLNISKYKSCVISLTNTRSITVIDDLLIAVVRVWLSSFAVRLIINNVPWLTYCCCKSVTQFVCSRTYYQQRTVTYLLLLYNCMWLGSGAIRLLHSSININYTHI